MVTDTTTPFLVVANQWQKLQPAMPNPPAYEKHIKLPPNVSYPAGQVVGPVTATSGQYKAPGTGVGAARLITPYPYTTDANGLVTLGTVSRADDAKFESVPAYFSGAFFLRDLTGVADDTIMNGLGGLIQGTGRTDTAAVIVLGG